MLIFREIAVHVSLLLGIFTFTYNWYILRSLMENIGCISIATIRAERSTLYFRSDWWRLFFFRFGLQRFRGLDYERGEEKGQARGRMNRVQGRGTTQGTKKNVFPRATIVNVSLLVQFCVRTQTHVTKHLRFCPLHGAVQRSKGGEAFRKTSYRRRRRDRPHGKALPGERGRGGGQAAPQDRTGAFVRPGIFCKTFFFFFSVSGVFSCC